MQYKITISPDAVTRYQDIPYEDRAKFREFINFRLSSDPEKRADDSTLHFRTLFSDLGRTLLWVGVCIDRQIVM